MATWKNRIIGHDEVDPTTLKANPKNWRLHPTLQRKAMAQVLDSVGVGRSSRAGGLCYKHDNLSRVW